jgi:hypothetical protein
MENYELNIEAPPKRQNNWFPKGHIPFNKELKWTDYFDMRKAKRVKRNLELGRKKGNAKLAGANKKPIVGIKDGKLIAFDSAVTAEKILKVKGIKINQRNICDCCHRKIHIVGTYSYIRKRAGGYSWFFADEVEKYKNLLQI